MKNNDLLTVIEVAKELNVSPETVRRWIRSKSLRAVRSGREFLVSRWHIDSFLIMGKKPLYETPDLLIMSSHGVNNAMKGALLFDQAYFKVEKQWERIQEDQILIKRGEERQNQELQEQLIKMNEWIKNYKNPDNITHFNKRPRTGAPPTYWLLPLKTLFIDIHFYFVAAEGLGKSVYKRLAIDIPEQAFSELIQKYRSIFKEINEIRRFLEHIDEKITHPEYSRDLGNIDEKGFHFGNKYFNYYIEDIRKLRNELCDFFLSKTLPEKDGSD